MFGRSEGPASRPSAIYETRCSNLYRLGVPEMVIQRILRHANVSTTATYYIKTAADDVRNAMEKLQDSVAQDTIGTSKPDAVVM